MPMSSPQITRMFGLSPRCACLVAISTSLPQVLSNLRGGATGRAGPFDPVFAADGPFGSIESAIVPRMGYATKVLIVALGRAMRYCRVLAMQRHAIGI